MSTSVEQRDVAVGAGDVVLPGFLNIPSQPRGLVAFAHGSGSSRFSSRNRFVADSFNERRLATLLFDLLTEPESRVDERTREFRFDIALLGRRTADAVDWLAAEPSVSGLGLGLFGASTGAAAAIIAAAERPGPVRAVVSRGGRPDLAGDALGRIQAPTLLIVGGRDTPVIGMNKEAAAAMKAPCHLEIVPGATHLFEEPGTLESVAGLAGDWFERFLSEPA